MSNESDTRGLFIQSFNHFSFVLYHYWKWDWLTDLLCKSKNQPTNTWMDKRCSFYAVNNNYKIIITKKWHSVTRILYIQSLYHSVICSCLCLVNEWLRDWIDAYSDAIIYPGPANNKANKNSNNNEIGCENGHQYRWLIIWKWKWIQSQCL